MNLTIYAVERRKNGELVIHSAALTPAQARYVDRRRTSFAPEAAMDRYRNAIRGRMDRLRQALAEADGV